MPSPRIAPNTDPGNLGDTVDPWDAWLNGDIDSSDLPPDLAVQARAVASGRVAKHGSPGEPGYAQKHPNSNAAGASGAATATLGGAALQSAMGQGYSAGGEEFQRDQESWFNGMLGDRQGSGSPLLTEGQMRLPQDQKVKAAVAARLAERMSDIPADRMAEAAFVSPSPSRDESRLLTESRQALQPGSWVAIRDPLTSNLSVASSGSLMVRPDDGVDPGAGWVRSGTPEAAAKVRQAAASRMVEMWAASSNDENVVSLAIQDAAAAEFGMKDHAPWPAQGDVGKVARQRADAMTASHGDVYRSYVRAQYDETQAMFKEMGVGTVLVHRGVKVRESDMRDAFQASATEITGEARLRPLSSWSTRYAEAVNFAQGEIPPRFPETVSRVVVTTRLPVSQILSTPYTGVGCLNEDEVVSATPTIRAEIDIIERVG